MKKHPQLAKKFQLLFALQINPALNSYADIARVLGVSRQSVSRWCRGTATSQGDTIPQYQLSKIASEFDLAPHWFGLAFEEFESRVKEKKDREVSGDLNASTAISTSTMPITNLEIFGRDGELQKLNSYWEDESINIVQLIAFGGVGKSTLTNRWLSELHAQNYGSAKRVYAWSFYWQGESCDTNSSGDLFIEHALEWFGDSDATLGTPWAKASRLTKYIRKSKALLILDGLEPMQFPPGPKCGQIENPAIALLIRELAASNHGLCVITSRMQVEDLVPFEDGRIATIDLNRLSVKASKQLLRSMGVDGNEKVMEYAAEYYSGHALSLSLLGGYLTVVYEGEIEKIHYIDSLAEEQKLGHHASKLIQAYLKWFKNTPELELLYWISMFDRPVNLSTIKSISCSETIDGLSEKLVKLRKSRWAFAVELLKDANLISAKEIDSETVLDCHPIVRDFVANHLKVRECPIWVRGNELIFDHLQNVAVENPGNMAELEPLFRAVIHGIQASMVETAFELYFDRIKKGYIMLSSGNHYADQACIKAFFRDAWTDLDPNVSRQY